MLDTAPALITDAEVRENQKYLNVIPLGRVALRLTERQNRLTRLKGLNAPACLIAREQLLVDCAAAALSRRTIVN